MRRLVCGVAVALTLVASVVAPAFATGAEWHSETPVAAGIGVPAPLGEVGDVAFWAPNRGVLITAGIEGAMPSGVYAYDGTGWHLYSTVCGGHEGRVAWAGPDEFWTVSDYATQGEGTQQGEGKAQTLCHFVNGEVVASYAEPIGSPDIYQQMKAAACDGPTDCWFAGKPLPSSAPNVGPFHLHWDGSGMTDVPSLDQPQPQIENLPGTVTGLAFFEGTLYESVNKEPYLREVNLARPEIFTAVTLPEGVKGPFALSADGGQLWAVSEPKSSEKPVALRSIGLGFETIPLERRLNKVESGQPIATEPNGAAVWAGEPSSQIGGAAAVTRIDASGAESAPIELPRPEEELNPKGHPTAIACPAVGQCWMATEKGWLFHLGEPLPQDTDPAMHVLITSRPKDNSTRSFVAAGLPEDNSGETEESKGFEEPPGKFPTPPKAKAPVVPHSVHQRIIGKRTLELSFVLRVRAHVQLLAKYRHKVVAKTPRLTLAKGAHKLRLKLDPKRWPTGLAFHVHPAHKKSS